MNFLFYGVIIPSKIYVLELFKYDLKELNINYDKLTDNEIIALYIDTLKKQETFSELEGTDEVKYSYEWLKDRTEYIEPQDLYETAFMLKTNRFVGFKIFPTQNNYLLDIFEEIKQENINKLNLLLKKYNFDSFIPKIYMCTQGDINYSTNIKEGIKI